MDGLVFKVRQTQKFFTSKHDKGLGFGTWCMR